MLKAVLHRRALGAAFVVTGLVSMAIGVALGVLAAARIARWAASLAPGEPTADDPSSRSHTPRLTVASSSDDAGIHGQASPRHAGGNIMQDAVNG